MVGSPFSRGRLPGQLTGSGGETPYPPLELRLDGRDSPRVRWVPGSRRGGGRDSAASGQGPREGR
ncbi:protein of unknown function [Modestobacter italicus]|uniref:Uncharacterized protein n=1 Tax=Modestobacter italicus (strain DSM 44449 / CECT 9708 / BC 501) TaxID=2732864 RepID=I4EV51_MODI5|nr:protein of unknown function [Modestobacter marinus]